MINGCACPEVALERKEPSARVHSSFPSLSRHLLGTAASKHEGTRTDEALVPLKVAIKISLVL